MASKLDGIQYSNKTKDRMEQYAALTKDLNKLNKENPALTKGKLVLNKDGSKSCIIHDNAIGIHIKMQILIMNFTLLQILDAAITRIFLMKNIKMVKNQSSGKYSILYNISNYCASIG